MSEFGLNSAVDSLRQSINEFLYSGNYNVTEEIVKEAKTIIKGVDKIKLDNLFIDSSLTWSQELNRNQIINEQKSNEFINYLIKIKISYFFIP